MAISSSALNGTSSSAKHQSVYLEFWQVSQSIANNTTTFGYKAYMKSNVSGADGNTAYGHYEFTGANPITKVTNQTWSWTYATSQLIKEGTFTKTHNTDGTLTNQTLTVTAGGSTTLGYATVSVTLPVATIPRATTPTLNYTTRDMGQSIVISVNGASTAFVHNLYYSFTGIAKTLITTVFGGVTSYSWTIPIEALAREIPNATSGTVTITAETLSGTTLIGTKTTTFTALVPSSVIPTISEVTATEAVAGLASQFGAFIQGKSKLSLSMTASGVYGSSISSYSITANGQTFSASSGTTGLLNTVGTNTITYKATDSRGRSATATLNVTVLAYTAPQISVFKVERVNGSGVADATGDRVKATYAITVTSLGGRNSKSYELKYKTSTASSYISIWLDATSFTPNTATIPAVTFSTSYVYNFELVANDYFGSTTVTGTVNSGFVPMHFRAGGKGVGIGMRSTKEAFEVGMPFFLGGLENFHAKHALPNGTDLNTVTQPGSYRIKADPVNAPSGSAWSQMLVIYGGGDTIAQLVFPYDSDAIWRRSGNPSNTGGTGSWRSWTLVGGDFLPLSGGTLTGSLTLPGSVVLAKDPGYNALRISNPNGYLQVGPLNTGTCHMYTDRPSFYFNKSLIVNGTAVSMDGHTHTYTLYYPTFTTGWTNWGNGYQPVSYFKDAFNIIHLQGMAQSTSTAQYVFTLPAGWRPAYNHVYTVNYNGAQSNLYVTTDGVVHHANSTTSAGKWLSLDGICFEKGA